MDLPRILTPLVALAAVLGLILLARRLAPLLGAVATRSTGRTAGALSLIATLPLDPRRRLHLVAVQGRHVVLLTGGPQDVLVGWIEPVTRPAMLP